MKRYRIRKGSIADKAVKAACAIESQPWQTIAFCITMAVFTAVLMLAYNSVVPAYQ